MNYVSLRFHMTPMISRRIAFVALVNVDVTDWFTSEECGDDWVRGYHSLGP